MKSLEKEYNMLKNNADINGWRVRNYRDYTRIRHELKEECKDAENRNLEAKNTDITNISKNTIIFWNKINQLRGHNHTYTNYLENEAGVRFYTDKEKCIIMEVMWKDIFRITEEEEAKFDRPHSEHIEAFVNINDHRVNPYNTSDLTRLDDNCFYTRQINIMDINRQINKTKKQSPGFY